jgi:hypothetical protein
MMNRKILGIAVTILAIAMLASPVMAKGPARASEIGNNPHLSFDVPGDGYVFMTGASGNTFIWSDALYHDCDSSNGGGRMNHALIVDWAMFVDMGANEEQYLNKWVFLSTDPTSGPGDGNSILWWFGQIVMQGGGAEIVANHPDGLYAMWQNA